MVDRISITGSRILCKDASGNTTFDTQQDFMRTDTNGQFQAGGHLEVPVVHGQGSASNIKAHEFAGGYLESSDILNADVNTGSYNLTSGVFTSAGSMTTIPSLGTSARPRAYDYNSSTNSGAADVSFVFSLQQGIRAFRNSFAKSSDNTAYPDGSGTSTYLLRTVFEAFTPFDSGGNVPTVPLKLASDPTVTVGQVYFTAIRYFTFFNSFNNGAFTMLPVTLPQWASGDLRAGGTYTCQWYANPKLYDWKDRSGTNFNSHVHDKDVYWAIKNTYRFADTVNLALVKTA